MWSMFGRNWWLVALQGALAVLFGILALVWPRVTLLTLIILFGAYALVDGLFSIIAGLAALGQRERWWGFLLRGIAGLVIGIVTLIQPGITTVVLLSFIAAWAIVTGIFEVVAGFQLRRQIEGEWLVMLSGVLSIIFGVVLFLFPGPGALGLIWLIAIYAILFGLLTIGLALRLRSLSQRLASDRTPAGST